MKKKLFAAALSLMMVAGLVACSSGNQPAGGSTAASGDAQAEGGWKFERKIEIVCPWGAGGGADTTTRQFATALEKELGVSVVVNNKTGAGGVSGVEYAISQPADGYTWLMCTPSPMLAQISGATTTDVYGSITPVCNMVHDCNIFVTSAKSPFNNYEEMMKYIEENPNQAKCGVMSVTGLDNACVIGAFEGKVESVAYSEGSQLNSDIIGQHVLLACVGPAEVSAMIASGDMKAILSCTEERLKREGFENVECTKEVGNDTFYGPYRGIFAKNGTPQEAIDAFAAAAEKAVASEEFQNWAKTEGLNERQGWYNTADYKGMWDEDFKNLTEIFGNK